jgi:hypothetical protein
VEGSPQIIKVISDHWNLTYFNTHCQSNYNQSHWSELLPCFDFKIDYWPGKAHGKGNALTCQGQISDEDSDLQEVYSTKTL